jgi:hypothetical protein
MKAKLSACLHAIGAPLCASVEQVKHSHRVEPYYYLRLGEQPDDFVAFVTADQLRELAAAIAAAPGIAQPVESDESYEASEALQAFRPITARPVKLTAPEFKGESDMERARRSA